MLRQEINLYRHFETPHTSADLLTWKRYWLANAAVIILLFLIYFASIIENIYSKNRAKKLEVELATYQADFKKTKNTLPQLFFNKDVNEAIKNMKSDLAAQQEIISILSQNEPFSEILTSFSRNVVPNVWLTNIQIEKNGGLITIKGNTIGSNVDDYLAKIDQDKFFKQYEIKLNEVQNKNVQDPDTKLNFEISMEKHT